MVKDGGNATCAGTKCPDGQVCRDQKCGNLFPGASGVGGIAGKIKYEAGKFIDAVYLKVVCKDGTVSLSSGQTVASNITIGDDLKIFGFKLMAGDKPYNFDYVDILEDSTSVCNSQDNVLGYYLELEINDDDYPISNLGYSTDDIWNGGISMCSNITGSPSCGFSGANDLPEPDEEEIIANAIARVGQYIPFESIKKGFVCDFDINKNTTPNVGKSLAGIAGKGILDILLSDSLFDPKSNKITAAFEKGGIFSVNHYISGANYQCSSFDKSASEYKDKLKKRACKCWDTPVISAGYKAKHTKAEVCGGN
ncbi:MAG: hypothetical protein ACD_72C00321G0001 [uncultured bacterium]|nr:MAG: hypothetical protein ACD_72C00321G0001 [uncultured bacterium]